MISIEEADKFLEKNKLEKPNLGKLIEFEESYRQLGKIISQSTKAHKENERKKYNKRRNNDVINLECFNEAFKEKDFNFNPFENQEGERLAEFFFGKVIGSTVALVWEKIDTLPYQEGYYRRSFRMNQPNKNHLIKKIRWLQWLYRTRTGSEVSSFFGMNILEIVQYMGYRTGHQFSLPLAVYLEKEENTQLKELVWDIFLAEDEIGAVSSGLIRGVLLSEDSESWEMVGKLLLSAQRQEGLRQTILETLDETSIGGLKYVIKLILEHNLYRFSSVVRAVDTWFGFGWDAPKKATIKRVLELSDVYLNTPEKIEKTMKKSRDNLELYVALWAKAVTNDVGEANLLAIDMIKNDKAREKKLLAFMFMEETRRTDTVLVEWIYENFGQGDVVLDYYMLKMMPMAQSEEMVEKLFEKIKNVANSIPKKGVSSNGKVFEWKILKVTSDYFYRKILNNANEAILKSLGEDISAIPSDVRSTYMLKVFPIYYRSRSAIEVKLKFLDVEETHWQREVMYQALVDRNESVLSTGLNLLRSIKLYEKEYQLIETVLKRKGKFIRSYLMALILKQDETIIQIVLPHLLVAKDLSQRLAGLEMLSILYEKKRLIPFVKQEVEHYATRKKPSKNEEIFLSKIFQKKEEMQFTHANGYGVVDYTQLQPIYQLSDKFAKIDKQKNIFDDFIDKEKIANAVNGLADLYTANGDYEYTYESWDEERVTTLLIKRLEHSKQDTKGLSKEEKFKLLPLWELWDKWYKESNLSDIEMMVAYGVTSSTSYEYVHKPSKEMITRYYPSVKNLNFKIEDRWGSLDRKIHELILELIETYCDRATIVEFQLDMTESMAINFPTQMNNLSSYMIGRRLESYWKLDSRELELIERRWRVDMALFYKKLDPTLSKTSTQLAIKIKNLDTSFISNSTFTHRLYMSEVLNHHDFFYHLLLDGRVFIEALEERRDSSKKYFKELSTEHLDVLKENYAQLKTNLLEVELSRGDVETEASRYIYHFSKIEGIDYFARILAIIGKAKLNTHVFSAMLRKTVIKEGECYEDFVKQLSPLKLTHKRWLEIAMYLPQWSAWIGKFIKLEALKDAVWWFKAHASETYSLSDEDKALIVRYSSVDGSDFERGALDIEWFNEVYPKIKKANWTILTEFAKYSCNSNGHRLVKLYSSIILGQVKIREINKKIKEKRDKDYLRGLGLVPLSKKTPQKDLLNRYNLFQIFLKESKQFGSQRQESEKNAVAIAMENLSRTAGYSDSIRLSLAMEAKATQEIMDNAVLTFDEVVLTLKIDDFGKADIFIEKGGKTQKSIPAKYKKEKAVKALVANKNYLKKQYSRIVKFLEESMVSGEKFSIEEIETLMQHPVVKALLSKLVLLVNGKELATFGNDGFSLEPFDSIASDSKPFERDDSCVIAHPVHLYKSKKWSEIQKFAFDTKLVQPFKQIFRELYLITDDEKEKAIHSKRYEGHQVQPQKTVALLKTRGWRVDDYDGLQKIFHKEGYSVTLYAMADWYSPSDVESPTLEHITFYSLKEGKNIKLIDVNEIVFSEVMRDIDLVVSVAHVGGVDPEASHSTLEMRAVLAKESVRLFKLDNVEVKARHILIEGKLGNYSIHLGSGMVAKGGLHLSIIPVHSQHRGRIFLPFIDDDPKSAEIISKMKLLSEDNKIQDPTILSQINS